eukprot:2221593-Rhodomonas_salina.1
MDIYVKPTAIPLHPAGPEATNPFKAIWESLRSFDVVNVGLCVSAVEMVIGLTGKTRKEAQDIIINLLKPATAASKREAAEPLLARRHTVPGFEQPTPLVTFQEGMQLLRLLPPKHVGHVLEHIDATFQGVQGGDMRIVDRVAENAASDAPINRVARDGLGLPRDTIGMIEDPETRALKKRRMLAEVVRMEKENEEYALEVAEKNKAAFERLFGRMDDRDQLMLKDSVMNGMYGPTAAKMITDGNENTREETTIDEVITKVGNKPTRGDRIQIGKLVAQGYRERYQREPPMCRRWVDGAQRDVKCYLKSDEPWMLDIAHGYYNSE